MRYGKPRLHTCLYSMQLYKHQYQLHEMLRDEVERIEHADTAGGTRT